MLRISSVAYAIIFVLTTHFSQEVLSTSFQESILVGMVMTIAMHFLTSWNYICYAFNNFALWMETDSSQQGTVIPRTQVRIMVIGLMIGWAIIICWLSWKIATVNSYFPELTYGLCILLIFIANYRTNLYKQYADLHMRRKSAGLKSL